MCILDINSDARSVFRLMISLLSLIFVFPLLLLKTFSFSRSPQNLSEKNDDLGLIHRWIVMKFDYHVRNPILSILTVGNFKIMSELREIPFSP